MPTLPANERKEMGDEVQLGYSPETAMIEARRCLKCDYNITINSKQCILCAGCVDVCPYGCIQMISLDQIESNHAVMDLSHMKQGVVLIIDEEFCIRCGLCVHRCPTGAIRMERFEIPTQVDY
jgi:formate hydrogenlyase subunit 6/NADH:ubiquinone oxidoreductase subunit I